MAVRREVAGLPVGAGDHTEPQARRHRVGGRRGQRTPDRRPRVAEPETVPVGRFWSEAAPVDLDGMVALRTGLDGTGGHHRAEPRITGHLPVDADPWPEPRSWPCGAGSCGRGYPPWRIHLSTIRRLEKVFARSSRVLRLGTTLRSGRELPASAALGRARQARCGYAGYPGGDPDPGPGPGPGGRRCDRRTTRMTMTAMSTTSRQQQVPSKPNPRTRGARRVSSAPTASASGLVCTQERTGASNALIRSAFPVGHAGSTARTATLPRTAADAPRVPCPGLASRPRRR